MCGIAGYVTTTPNTWPDQVLTRMTGAIRHRGPDDERFYRDAYAQLGHRRLSIIDVAAGHQPMANEDGRFWIIYNGEVFNHASLRPALEQAGHRYQTRCDTETLLHAYEEHGERSVQAYRGMFAYAIWDQHKRRLFCARDRLGIKPFYYYWDGRVFAFASEIKALLQHPAISARFHDALLGEHLTFGYTSGAETLFQGIRRLPPGHTLTLDLQAARPEPVITQYWDVPRDFVREDRSAAEWIGECRRRLEETVQMRLMSDVPLGMFLSGGVDSSAIAALIKRMVSGPVQTFAVGYAEAQYSELPYAAKVAQAIGTEHHEIAVSMEDFFQALPKLVWHEDEPITWASSVSLYFVSQLAAQRVKVVLTGEGSDELFAGYERYRHHAFNHRWMQWYRHVPDGLRGALRTQLEYSTLLSGNLRRKVRHTFLGRTEEFESLYLDNFLGAFGRAEQEHLLQQPAGRSPYAGYRQYWDVEPQPSLLSRLLYTDQKTYLAELLMKQDQMSMACSIESRVPFLDHTFVEFAARVPDDLKLHGTTGKYILKEAIADLLPPEIIHRKKMGFPTPLRSWLRDERSAPLYDVLRQRDGLLAEYIDRAALENLIARQQAGQEDATDRLWRLLNLQLWGDIYLTGKRDPADGLLQVATAAAARR